MPGLRVIFFGMEGVFSRAPVRALIEAHFNICAVIVPRPTQSQPPVESIQLLTPPHTRQSDLRLFSNQNEKNIIGTAWEAGVPVYETDRLKDSRTLATLRAFRPDVICVACYPQILPQSLIANYPALNLHPSLLPAYRGPAPLFWIFHDGLENAGITLHLMDRHADTGNIVAQERISLRDGISYADAEKDCSEKGARLLVDALRSIELGSFAHTPQSPNPAPRAPNPTDADYVITPMWSARRAFNFIRGVGGNVRLETESPFGIGDWKLNVVEAIAFNENETLSEPFRRNETFWKIQMSKGTLLISARQSPAANL